MAQIIRVQGLDEFKRDLSRAGSNVKPIAEKALDKGAMVIKTEAQLAITRMGTTYKGKLQRSISIVRPGGKLQRLIGTNLVYAEIIHEGKRGGAQPPTKALEAWARVKLGKPGMGFVIARAIKKRGGIVNKNPFMDSAVKLGTFAVIQIFKDAHKEILKPLGG